MPRPKPQPKRGRTGVVNVRLWTEEKEGLAQLAETLGETPSRVLRRLIREAINGGPDYFEDGAGEIRRMRYELTRIGRNLNQFARAVNRGERVMSADLRRAFNACTVQTEAVKLVYRRAVEAAAARGWRPLYRDGGLVWPFGEQTEPPDGPVRSPKPSGEPGPAPGRENYRGKTGA